jgi:hypothetical protein
MSSKTTIQSPRNPLIEPAKGNGRSRWRQTTRRVYIRACKKAGTIPRPATPAGATILDTAKDPASPACGPTAPLPALTWAPAIFYYQ